jgi:diaminopimelate decarboxylase
MSDTYESPRISEELGGLPSTMSAERNPLARGYAGQSLTEIDGCKVEDIADQVGSPAFVFSERTLRQKIARMRAAFRSRYPDTHFFWSYKTNNLDAICNVFKSEGWGAEIVSHVEYLKARHLGFEGGEIVFNGPYKRPAAVRQALDEGALIQIDNWDDLDRVETAADELGGTYDVGIRVWFATGHGPTWSKFGFNLASGEAQRAARRIAQHPRLRLHTLHSHIGTYMLDPEAYRVAVRYLLGLRAGVEEDTGELVPCLNLGGGFPSYSLLHGMQGPPETAIAPIERYAEAITSELNRLPAGQRPQLRLESGRHLVDEAGYLITSVAAVKHGEFPGPSRGSAEDATRMKEGTLLGSHSKVTYVLDVGVNLLYTGAWFEITARPARETDDLPEQVRLVGDLCMEIDVIRENIALPRLRVGDRLTLWPVGAYNVGQSMQFIHLRPAMVMITEDSGLHIIRRQESFEDYEALEIPSEETGKV